MSNLFPSLVLFLKIYYTWAQQQQYTVGNLNFGMANPVSLPVHMSSTCSYHPLDFKAMTAGVEKILHFYESQTRDIVLDAAVGTRMLEASIGMILKGHPNLPQPLKNYLTFLKTKAGGVSDKIIQAVMVNPKFPMQEKTQTLPWVDNVTLWETPKLGSWLPHMVMQSYQKPSRLRGDAFHTTGESMEENTSNACIYQVFHCESVNVSPRCKELFLEREQSKYSLTHQVIYMILAERRSCVSHANFLSHFQNGDWQLFRERLCGKVWHEANEIVADGFPAHYRDLFTEQVAICGLAGYQSFLKREWLGKILSWLGKSRSGCFLEPRRRITVLDKLLQAFVRHRKRVKRSDATIMVNNESCSVHFTAVGASSLAVFMRHFVDTCLPY